MWENFETSISKTPSFREYVRNTNSQTAAPIQLRLNRDRRHTVIADSSGTDEAIRARLEVRSSRKDSSQETPTPSSFNSSHDFVARGRSASNNDGGDDDREDFVFPDPLSPVTEREVSSDAELMESSSSENTIVEAKLAAELCGSPQQKRSHKGKGIARDPTPATNSQEPIFLPLLKEDSHSQRHTDHKEQPHKTRSTSFHSKLAKLNKSLASGSSAHETPKQPARSREAERDAKILRHLRLQTLIQSDQIKHLKVVTKDLAEALNRLQGSIARDIQMLQENSEGMRENHNQLIGACEGMRRELLELKVRMAQEKFGQRVVSRDGDEHGDGDRRGAVPDLPFPPPHSLLQPTSMEYAFSTRPCYISPFDPCNSNPPPSTTVTGTNNLLSMPGAVITGQSLSQPPSASHAVNPNSAYNSVPLQYYDHYRESHILQNPQGCRWHYCSVCRGGGERVVPGFE